jgi:transcriptional regulator with XRE-family HTH domain
MAKAKTKAKEQLKESARPTVKDASGDDLGAAEMARRVAEVLKQLRAERRLSLDDLAARSGVSRAALSQIEGARTNPTLAVLWKIAVGLDVPFHDLLGSNEEQSVRVLRAGDAPPLRSGDGRMESRLLSPGGASTDVEVFDLRFQPKAVHKSDPHGKGTTETLVVLTGSLHRRLGVFQVRCPPRLREPNESRNPLSQRDSLPARRLSGLSAGTSPSSAQVRRSA